MCTRNHQSVAVTVTELVDAQKFPADGDRFFRCDAQLRIAENRKKCRQQEKRRHFFAAVKKHLQTSSHFILIVNHFLELILIDKSGPVD